MQQINLYLPEFQPNREPLRSIHMVWGLVAFILMLALITLLSSRQNQQRNTDIAQQRAQLEQLKIQVVQLEQQRPQVNLAELDAQTVKLNETLAQREQIYQVIANKNLGNNTGFSTHLAALGRQSMDTISLDAFSLLAGGNYVEFAGKTRSVDQVPLYVQRLRSEPAFSQSAFGVLNAAPQKSNADIFQFSLAQEPEKNSGSEPKSAVQKLIELNERTANDDPSRGIN